MSIWSYIVATILVDTCIQDDNIKNKVEEILLDAPKITGSEGNANIFVNVLDGYNSYTYRDCNRCEYKDTIIHHKIGGFSCDAEEEYLCPKGEYQTQAVITIVGSLRDRSKQTTKEEYKNFLKFIKDKFIIDNKTVKIEGW